MAIRSQVTALVLLTSAALVACAFGCSAGTAGDGTSSPTSGGSVAQEAPVTSPDGPKRGRPVLPVNAGKVGTTAMIAKLMEADGGGGGEEDSGSDAGSGAPSWEATVSTDTNAYAYGESITITYGSMSSDTDSWVGFAQAGSAATTYSWYAYTDGAASGTKSTATGENLPPGTYVARAYFGSSYVIKGESAPFTVGAISPTPGNSISIAAGASTNNEVFGGFETISATVSGLAADTAYDVGVFPRYGATSLPYATVTVTTNAEGSATAQLTELLSGVDYEIRVFQGTSWKLTSPTHFVVKPEVHAKKSSFGAEDAIEIEFAGVQGLSMFDKIVIAPTGSADSVVTKSAYADWYWSGKVTLDRPTTPGSYVARVFDGVGDTTTKRAQSVAFEIQ